MSIEYKWSVSPLECVPSKDGLTDIIKTIHWRYTGTDGTYSADVYGSMGLEDPEAGSFIEFDDLTEETVIGWLEANLEVETLQTNINNNIDSQINPPIVSKSAPWVS
jgi:hypothetical protein